VEIKAIWVARCITVAMKTHKEKQVQEENQKFLKIIRTTRSRITMQ
jgi:hypothetical protein